MTTKPEEGKPNVPDVFHRRKLEILAAEASTQPLPAPTEPSVDMRERFEDWIERDLPGTDLYIRSDGHYGDLLTAYLWKGWQAGAASQGAPHDCKGVLCPKCQTIIMGHGCCDSKVKMRAQPKEKTMTAKEFYEANATTTVNVPRVGHPEDKSGWDGVQRARQAQYIAPDVEVMLLWDVFDFAEKFRQAGAASQGEGTAPPNQMPKKGL